MVYVQWENQEEHTRTHVLTGLLLDSQEKLKECLIVLEEPFRE